MKFTVNLQNYVVKQSTNHSGPNKTNSQSDGTYHETVEELVYTQPQQRYQNVAEVIQEVKIEKCFTRWLSKRSMVTHHADEEHNIVGHLMHANIENV